MYFHTLIHIDGMKDFVPLPLQEMETLKAQLC